MDLNHLAPGISVRPITMLDDGHEVNQVFFENVCAQQAARDVVPQPIPLHGGMGVTDEEPAAHYFKRLSMIEGTFGDTDFHLTRFMARSRESMDEILLCQVA